MKLVWLYIKHYARYLPLMFFIGLSGYFSYEVIYPQFGWHTAGLVFVGFVFMIGLFYMLGK